MRAWFKWLAKQHHILYNPASEIELPKLEKRLPKHVLTQSEAEQVINQADVASPLGIRDRAILETLYSTGIRRMEVINLKLFDLDAERGTLMVRQGKGRKDRMIPIGERAIAWIWKYANDVRPELVLGEDDGGLYLTNLGEAFTPNRMTQLVRNYVHAADIGKTGSCHLFRHTMATLMLENGADIRFIQEMLGHVKIDNDADLHAGEHQEAEADPYRHASGAARTIGAAHGGSERRGRKRRCDERAARDLVARGRRRSGVMIAQEKTRSDRLSRGLQVFRYQAGCSRQAARKARPAAGRHGVPSLGRLALSLSHAARGSR